jgi:hypothetical protein
MREICTCGSEGGVAQANAPFLPLCVDAWMRGFQALRSAGGMVYDRSMFRIPNTFCTA